MLSDLAREGWPGLLAKEENGGGAQRGGMVGRPSPLPSGGLSTGKKPGVGKEYEQV